MVILEFGPVNYASVSSIYTHRKKFVEDLTISHDFTDKSWTLRGPMGNQLFAYISHLFAACECVFDGKTEIKLQLFFCSTNQEESLTFFAKAEI